MSTLSGAQVPVEEKTQKVVAIPKQLVPSNIQYLETLWKAIPLESLDNVFPQGLSNAVAYWVRLNCPIGLKPLIDVLAEGKQATLHRKKGWHAGICVLIALRVQKGGMAITEAEAPMWNNYMAVIPQLAALIFDEVGQRQTVKCVKLKNANIAVLVDQLDNATLKWLSKDWPQAK